jgi:uncharacterized protein YybS (DUF2232 family)
MSEMIKNPRNIIILGATITILIMIVSYAFFEFQKIRRGPIVQVIYPQNGQSLNEPIVAIRGLAQNIAYLYVNDRQIFVDEQDRISERLLLSPGYNIITLRAVDRFGKEKHYSIELVYQIPEKPV